MRRLLLVIFVLSFSTTAFPLDNPHRPGKKSYRFADKKLKKMSLDDKLGQLVHIGVNARFLNRDNPELQRLENQIRNERVGGITVFAGGIYESVHLINHLQSISKYPLLISADFETGVGMRFSAASNFPWNMALSAGGDTKLAEEFGYLTGLESRALGVHQVFAPVIDINNNPANPVINVRSFGEDPKTVAAFGNAIARGLRRGGVLATAKHFPGHGDTSVDSHRGLPVIDLKRKRLFDVELYPFRELVKGGIGSVMVSHISLPYLDGEKVEPLKNSVVTDYADSRVETKGTTIPATLSKPIVTGILRREMGFDGLIVTDAMDMNGLTLFFDQREAAVRAIEAGNDVLIKPASVRETIEGLRDAVKNGRLPIAIIDAAVGRQLAWKHELGLFKKRKVALESIDNVVSGKRTRKLTRKIANRAITLVKNAEGVLPLKTDGKTVFLAVTNGMDYVRVGRTFSNHLEASGFDVTRVIIDERSGKEEIEKAKLAVNAADTLVVGLFGRVRTGSKNSVGIPEAGGNVLKHALGTGKPLVAVAFGNPYLLNSYPNIPNYVVAYGDMASLQFAAADTLTGAIEFSGQLPISIVGFPAGSGLRLRRKSPSTN